MALNKKTFQTRTITAIVFVIIMLAGLLWHKWLFIALFSIIMIGCVVEFRKLVYRFNPHLFWLALVYIVLPVVLMIDLAVDRQLLAGSGDFPWWQSALFTPLLPCAIIFSIWINDTMAYIVGSLVGKTPFSKISPNKTWEGTVGGAMLCVVAIAILGFVVPAARVISVKHWIAIAAICAIFATLGDLLESKLKRMAAVKDSGHFMPGHGGFLDRFDSFLLAAPFVWVYCKLLL